MKTATNLPTETTIDRLVSVVRACASRTGQRMLRSEVAYLARGYVGLTCEDVAEIVIGIEDGIFGV